jgi:CxxC motif-containing protein (DUF1111 family)
MVKRTAVAAVLSLTGVMAVQGQFRAHDPGPRGGSVGAGQPVAGLTPDQLRYFYDGQSRFAEIDSVSGTLPGEEGRGLGPGFNSNQCLSCHAQPASGGTSPSQNAFPFVGPNPQVAVATLDGATNVVPSFITADGPVREARFKFVVNPNGTLSGTPDGGVHDLYTIAGRFDATNTVGITGQPQTCVLAQPNFNQMLQLNNVVFRIPTPVFGAGMIENISEATILQNMQANAGAKAALGISGHPNRNGNDGTIARFGWKAQNKSLQLFAGEAYNVEMGVANEIFQSERGYPPNPVPVSCLFNNTPEDATNMLPDGSNTENVPSDTVQFSTFMRLLDQPMPSCTGASCSPSIQNGRRLFVSVGCALCHTPTLQTSASVVPGLNKVNANLYSDLLVHNMGSNLADGVSQGAAGPDEFRTAPLWGVGQRLFFLHDGRTSDLRDAIRQHASRGSEANGVINHFINLSESQKQDLFNFLRSL